MASGQIYLVTTTVHSKLVIRFVVCSRLTEETDVQFAWNEIRAQADHITTDEYKKADKFENTEITEICMEKTEHVIVKSLTQG